MPFSITFTGIFLLVDGNYPLLNFLISRAAFYRMMRVNLINTACHPGKIYDTAKTTAALLV
jgi:hypothetical protein